MNPRHNARLISYMYFQWINFYGLYKIQKIKIADKASILNTKAKSMKIGLKETGSNRLLIADDDEWCCRLIVSILY